MCNAYSIHTSAARKPLGELPPPPSPRAGTCFETDHVHPLMAPDDAWEITSVGFGCMGDTTIGGRVWAYQGARRIDGALCHVWTDVDGRKGPSVAQTFAYHGTAP